MVMHGHDDYVNCVGFSPDGAQILTASADKTARIWDAATGAQIAVLQGHEDYVNYRRLSAPTASRSSRPRATRQRGSGTSRLRPSLRSCAATTAG